jgi:hypothetical protein
MHVPGGMELESSDDEEEMHAVSDGTAPTNRGCLYRE